MLEECEGEARVGGKRLGQDPQHLVSDRSNIESSSVCSHVKSLLKKTSTSGVIQFTPRVE